MWDKEQFKDDGKFKITYRYNGVIREATVEEVRLSFGILYRLQGKTHHWDITKKKSGKWKSTSPHVMNPELLKAIGEGIDKVK